MELLFHNGLVPGQLVNIFTHYMLEEESSYEGVAILLEKHSDGHSFSLYNEKLYTKEEDRVIDDKTGKHKPLTREQTKNNAVWEKLRAFFEDNPTKEIKSIKDKIKRKVARDNHSLIALYNTIREIKAKYVTSLSKVAYFLSLYSDDQIARYFQQQHIRYWSPTIFREERWLVEFIPEQYGLHNQMCLYNSPFRTYRKIRTIAKVSPSEDVQYCEIRKHTTSESIITNTDRRIKRLRIEEANALLQSNNDSNDSDDIEDDDDDIELGGDYNNSESELAEDSIYEKIAFEDSHISNFKTVNNEYD